MAKKENQSASEFQYLEKLYKRVFGGKCGYQRWGKNTEEAKLGATGSLWEINKFATLGRSQINISEKFMNDDLPYMQLEIYKDGGEEGWSVADDEIEYYFFIGQKYAYKVRSCWIYGLALRIQDFLDEDQKIKQWLDKINKSGTKQVKFITKFGVPSLPTEIEIELKCERGGNGLKILANVDWKQCMGKLKMDIERIKL